MAVQQDKVSKRKCRQRRSANRYRGVQSQKCPHCEATKLPHCVCTSCGHYKGRQILTVDVD